MYTAGDNKSRKSNYIKFSKSKIHIRHSIFTMSLQYLQIFSIGTLLKSSAKPPQSGILCLILALDVNWHSSKTWTSDWMLPHAQRRSSGGIRDHLPVSNFRWLELNRIRLKAILSCSLRLCSGIMIQLFYCFALINVEQNAQFLQFVCTI